MRGSLIMRNILERFETNELIFANRLYRDELAEYMSKAAYNKMLERMCNTGRLAKVAKGIYYIPNISKYGVVPPSEKKIIEAFTCNGTGTVIGYMMYNEFNLTTQVSKTVNIMSSALDGFSKTVRNIEIKQVNWNIRNRLKL